MQALEPAWLVPLPPPRGRGALPRCAARHYPRFTYFFTVRRSSCVLRETSSQLPKRR